MHGAPRRFYSLDVLRGLAALSVALHHWGHLYSGSNAAPVLPAFEYLRFFYVKGWLAVDLFFTLSGFVFFWLYSSQVSGRDVSARQFLVLRFSRIYPLHLATLFFVATGQALYFRMTGVYFVYPTNDALQFLHNVFLATAWSPWGAYSFNAPVWSVSIEVVLYVMFFALARLLPVRTSVLLVTAAFGHFILGQLDLNLARGVLSFFLGGCVFRAYRHILAADTARRWLRVLAPLVCVLWAVTIAYTHLGWGVAITYVRFDVLYTVVVLFPLTVLALALLETEAGPRGARLAVLGDWSYSVYLLHFPLQLAMVTVLTAMHVDRSVFSYPWMLVVYFGLLLVISRFTFRYFEKPAKRWMRDRWLPKGAAGPEVLH